MKIRLCENCGHKEPHHFPQLFGVVLTNLQNQKKPCQRYLRQKQATFKCTCRNFKSK